MKFTLDVLDPIIYRVLDKIVRRSNVGVRKYGTTLAENPATMRRWFVHLQEELMDAMNYSERIMAELNEMDLDGCLSCQAKEKQYTSLSSKLTDLDNSLRGAIERDCPISVEEMKMLRRRIHDTQAAIPHVPALCKDDDCPECRH